jgi:hypothetical protein
MEIFGEKFSFEDEAGIMVPKEVALGYGYGTFPVFIYPASMRLICNEFAPIYLGQLRVSL